jgi:hypothetical protein
MIQPIALRCGVRGLFNVEGPHILDVTKDGHTWNVITRDSLRVRPMVLDRVAIESLTGFHIAYVHPIWKHDWNYIAEWTWLLGDSEPVTEEFIRELGMEPHPADGGRGKQCEFPVWY